MDVDGKSSKDAWGDWKFSNRHLGRARKMLVDRETWSRELAKNDTERIKLQNVSIDVEEIFIPTRDNLEAQVKQLQGQAETGLLSAEMNRKHLGERREKGVRKISADIEKFLASFSQFITGYAGIVEIVKTADNNFGGLAWGTLSIFLNVAASKQKHEEDINNAMIEFTRHCPRLNTLNEIYPDEDLKLHIADMYESVIAFARAATVFYSQSSFSRIASSFNPRSDLERTILEIQTGLENIRRDCEALMQARLHKQSKDIEELTAKATNLTMKVASMEEKLSRVEADLKRTRKERSQGFVIRIKSSFDLPIVNGGGLSPYKNLLESTFLSYPRKLQPHRITIEILEKESAYRIWLRDIDAGVLFLSGKNAHYINQSTLSWLSEAAVLIIEQLETESHQYAYTFCQTKSLLGSSEKFSVKHIFASLGLQLLERRPPEDRRIESEIDVLIHGEEWKSDEEDDMLQNGAKLIALCLQAYDAEETVFLIIDRIDQCRWTGETERLRLGVGHALEALLRLVNMVKCRLKVLVVVESSAHESLSLSTTGRRGRLVKRTNWDQY